MSEWAGEFNSEAITSENRESFNTFANKYDSIEAAVVGGFNAQKQVGAPFKVPESMDKLPDDDSRNDFTAKARGLLGITVPQNVEALDSINFKSNLADDSPVDDNFINLVKNWAVEAGVDTATLQKMVDFNNGPLGEFATKAIAEKQERDGLAKAEEVNEALTQHYGSKEKVAELSELMRRAIQARTTPEEYAQAGDEMADAVSKNPVLARLILDAFAPLAAEGSTDGGDGHGGGAGRITPYQWKKQRFPKSENQWGKPEDSWENESIQLRKMAGIK